MYQYKKIILTVIVAIALFSLFCQPVFAITESDVQAQVDASSKEAVSGNVLIWFLCAVAFLKVSQKIDSFMSSLGVNVGHTGGSMLAEALIAARGIGGIRNYSNARFGGNHSSRTSSVNSGNGSGGGFLSGGLAGIASRKVTQGAMKTVTTPPGSKTSGNGIGSPSSSKSGSLGGHIYASSVNKGGDFANNVISTVATGNFTSTGSITGEKASEALHSYMGYAALGESADNVPTFSNVEIGGGRITGTETSDEHPEGIAFGMYHAAQYAAPDGNYSTVHAVDGSA